MLSTCSHGLSYTEDLWIFREDSSEESKSCSSSKIEKIQRPGGQKTLLRWVGLTNNITSLSICLGKGGFDAHVWVT
jgi:hypothetical protein